MLFYHEFYKFLWLYPGGDIAVLTYSGNLKGVTWGQIYMSS